MNSMEVRYNNYIKIDNKSSHRLKFSLDFNINHEVDLEPYRLCIGRKNPKGGGNFTEISLTFDDMKALRKELRKIIRHESNK